MVLSPIQQEEEADKIDNLIGPKNPINFNLSLRIKLEGILNETHETLFLGSF